MATTRSLERSCKSLVHADSLANVCQDSVANMEMVALAIPREASTRNLNLAASVWAGIRSSSASPLSALVIRAAELRARSQCDECSASSSATSV